MKSIKYLVMLVCMTIGLSMVGKAQIYSSEALFYIEAGMSLKNNSYLEVVIVDNETNKIFIVSTKMSYIERDGLSKYDNPNFIYHCKKKGATVYECRYNPTLSKNGKEVYQLYDSVYYVFSSDKSTYVKIKNNGNDKIHYVRVTRDKLILKDDSKYDFLYD